MRLAAGGVALVALAVQLFMSALYGPAAVPRSLPHALAGEWPFAVARASGLDRFAGVRLALARGALLRGDAAAAATWLGPLAATPEVVDTRGRIALAQGDTTTALRDFEAVGDFSQARAAIDRLAARDPVAALAVIADFDRQLSRDAPEITAEVEWREGQIAAAAAAAHPQQAATYDRLALAAYARALQRAPNDEKYLLNYAFQALRVGDPADARRAYARAAQVVPDSVDAFVGLAVSAAVLHDCATARDALARARAFAAAQRRTADPLAAGYAAAPRAALTRCSGA